MNDPDRPSVGTYLTDEEAKEIHGAFMGTFALYVMIALIAHAFMYAWKPWFTGGFGQ
ncbi:MAG: light-harvesting antenna LH1, beta subunit [Pseudomonadota bacterium]